MSAPRGTCQFCGQAAPAKATCQTCVDNIVKRGMAGESFGFIAADLSTAEHPVTRNAIIGLFGRNKPEGVRHPTSAVKKFRPRRPKPRIIPDAAIVALYGPPSNPVEFVGCRWIDHDGEKTYGKHAKDASRKVCQAPQQPGSSYCPHHHARVWRTLSQSKADRLEEGAAQHVPKGSRRTPVQAHQ